LILGSILGVFCIVGALTRYNESPTTLYLLSFWFNRVIIGLVIGLLPLLTDVKKTILRGAIVGLFISFAFYSATEFYDLTGFLVGAVYGMIIEVVLYKYIAKGEKL
jgi:hypothetical protein